MPRLIIGLLGVVVLAGCDVVFGLAEPGVPGDAGGVSDGTDAPLPLTPRCTEVGQMVELPLVADTYLRAGVAAASGSEPAAYVAEATVTLVRFEPGVDVFDEVTVTLAQADKSLSCSADGACGPCPVGSTGTIEVSFVRPDWDEQVATYQLRAPGLGWATPGAAGADRSPPAAIVSFDGAELTVMSIPLAGSRAANWPPGLSLLFAADSTGAAVGRFHTREAEPTCGAPMRPRAFGRCAGVVTPACGNDVIDTGESCDDGNLIDDDGCSAFCQVEATCGNGTQDAGEGCDDGNNLSGDGCANCIIVPVPV